MSNTGLKTDFYSEKLVFILKKKKNRGEQDVKNKNWFLF